MHVYTLLLCISIILIYVYMYKQKYTYNIHTFFIIGKQYTFSMLGTKLKQTEHISAFQLYIISLESKHY